MKYSLNKEWNVVFNRENKGAKLKDIKERILKAANDPAECDKFIGSKNGLAIFSSVSKSIGAKTIVDEDLSLAIDIIADKVFAPFEDLERII